MDRKEYLKNSLLLERIEIAQYIAGAIEKREVLNFQDKRMVDILIELEKLVKHFCAVDLLASIKVTNLTTEEYQEVESLAITIIFDKYIIW